MSNWSTLVKENETLRAQVSKQTHRAESAEWERDERKKQLLGAEEALRFFTRSAELAIDTVKRVRDALGDEWVLDEGGRENFYYCPVCLNFQGGPHAPDCMAAKVRAALSEGDEKR